MGITEWDKVGLSVDGSSARLHRIAYVDRQLMRIEAGHMTARPEYEVKGALGRMVWQDASFVDQLRTRCKQLRMSARAFDKCPDPALQAWMELVLHSDTTLKLLMTLFEVVKPAQVTAIQAYLRAAQPIVDEPSIHLLRHQLIDREDQLAWGIAAIQELLEQASTEEREAADRWKQYMQAMLTAAGGVDGLADRIAVPQETILASVPFALPKHSTRDARFTPAITKFYGLELEDSNEGRLKQMMHTRFFEMTPAEAIAYIHFATEGKPWGFYYDTARHLWDEIRHAWFGEAALRSKGYDIYKVPNWTGWYEMTSNLFNVDEAYIHLTVAIEKAGMKYPPGKREEWEFCRDMVKDELMTTFQDFDWADEVVHVGFGQKWVVEELFDGDVKKAMKAADDTVKKREVYMATQGGIPQHDHYAGGY